MNASRGVWSPDPAVSTASNLEDLRRWLRDVRGKTFDGYHDLYGWSVAEPGDFWAALAEYFDVLKPEQRRSALAENSMPGARWFPDARLNYVDQVLRHVDQVGPAIIDESEAEGERRSITWPELRRQAAAIAETLRRAGVGRGDVVAGYVPNVPEAMIAFLATASLGAIWACCGQDLAPEAAAARLGQLKPTALITADGYRYASKVIDKRSAVGELVNALETVELTVLIPRLGLDPLAVSDHTVTSWAEASAGQHTLMPEPVPFDHPLWVLFSSGTTGRPKGIIHGHGGVLLEHLKQLWLHFDLDNRDVFFWHTSPSWMMWNFQVGGLLVGATVVCFDGSPTYPGPEALWDIVGRHNVSVFGTSPAHLQLCEKAAVRTGAEGFPQLRIVGATGAVVPDSAYRWVAARFDGKVALASISGGTDVVSAFAGAVPTLPVREGELTAAALGVALESWDESGRSVRDKVGELVITQPMPSMPIGFWNDPDGSRYRAAYFDTWPGVWRHGDWITLTNRGSVVFHGRSDSTLNRNGIRMGSAELYAAVEQLPEVEEALVVGVELADGGYWMPLFLSLAPGHELDQGLRARISRTIRDKASPRHVPDDMHVVSNIPHTRTGKKLEVPVKRILQGSSVDDVVDVQTVDRPELLDEFVRIRNKHHSGAVRHGKSPSETGSRRS